MKNQARIQRYNNCINQVSIIGFKMHHRCSFSQIAANQMTDSFSLNGYYTIGTLVEDDYLTNITLYSIVSLVG